MKLRPDWLDLAQAQELVRAFASDGAEMRFVGGAVRDALLGIKGDDIDAATPLLPQEVLELLEQAGIRAIPTGIAHGTVTAVISGRHFEITTLRRDIACDGRHADVDFTDNWRGDAARRDFTMNALYLSPAGEIFDYFGGIEDARSGIVRFIGDARARITEDRLRILRFFRFFAYYGKTAVDEMAYSACKELAPCMKTLSGERIQQEMLKLLAAPAPCATILLMRSAGVLAQVFPFGINFSGNMEMINSLGSANLRLAFLLLHSEIAPLDAVEATAKRWRLSGDMKKLLLLYISRVGDISGNHAIARQKHLIRKLGAEDFTSLVALKAALEPQENYKPMLDLASNWQPPLMPVNGGDLIEAGLAQGKDLGEQLRRLEKIWEESDYKLTREELLKELKG